MNRALAAGDASSPGVLPALDALLEAPFVFDLDFGLRELPQEPGILLVRGPRQYGKSTWLQQQVRATVQHFGPGSAFYLTGDELADAQALVTALRATATLFRPDATVRRIFVDEVTAVDDWARAVKTVADSGELRRVLLVTTGSSAADLRRGSERLPGRKGRLARTTYVFTPLPYAEFRRVCGATLGPRTLDAYLLSGGAPVACAELAARGHLPEHVVELVRDWILGECSRSGRVRSSVVAVLECLHRFAATPVGHLKLAREAGLANNTVAAGYVEFLADLLCAAPVLAWDEGRRRPERRRPCKFAMTNLLAAVVWHPRRPRSLQDLAGLEPEERGALVEWLVAQELVRRRAVAGHESPEQLYYWRSAAHELDYVLAPDHFLEVKSGPASPVDFAWFAQSHPHARLTVVGTTRFATDYVTGVTLEDFLLEAPGRDA